MADLRPIWAVSFLRLTHEKSLSCAEFYTLPTDALGYNFTRVFDVESEAFVAKTELFDMVFRKKIFRIPSSN